MAAVIDKVPPKWKSFALSLKHKKDLSTINDLIISLQIKEKYRENNKLSNDFQHRVNLVEKNKNKKFRIEKYNTLKPQ